MDKGKTQKIVLVVMAVITVIAIAAINHWIASQVDELKAGPSSPPPAAVSKAPARAKRPRVPTFKIDPAKDPLAPRPKRKTPAASPQLLYRPSPTPQDTYDPDSKEPVLVQ